ncbi:MAG: hypothetical protein K0Q73_3812 [Paenibacillus sp.]|jgi:hypothetical protein|nr:hypothetical protein [Paenibacillus sp.]
MIMLDANVLNRNGRLEWFYKCYQLTWYGQGRKCMNTRHHSSNLLGQAPFLRTERNAVFGYAASQTCKMFIHSKHFATLCDHYLVHSLVKLIAPILQIYDGGISRNYDLLIYTIQFIPNPQFFFPASPYTQPSETFQICE